jgi:hypothetical protein
VRVVDGLEEIDVEKKDAEGAVGTQGALSFLMEEVEESGTVPETGEGIVGSLVAELLLGDKEVALGGEEAFEGLAFFVGDGFGVDAKGARFLQLGLNLAGLRADAPAEAEVAGGDDEDQDAEGRGQKEGVAGGPPGGEAEDLDVRRRAEEEVERAGSAAVAAVDDANAAHAEAAADADAVKDAGGALRGEHREESGPVVIEAQAASGTAEELEQSAIELDGLGVVGSPQGLGGSDVDGRGERRGAEGMDEGAVEVRGVLATGREADDIEPIAGLDGNGILGGDEDAVRRIEE